MNIKDLIEAAKFQATVKPHDEFIVEVAKRLEMLYEQNNNQQAEIERLEAEKQQLENDIINERFNYEVLKGNLTK